ISPSGKKCHRALPAHTHAEIITIYQAVQLSFFNILISLVGDLRLIFLFKKLAPLINQNTIVLKIGFIAFTS
ncbi:hypothetical protein, partial [Providencia rettgeri]|uniref:hypothetical protein n=1 Tax=Providencia rettgeri TaxID=587 RepID=UPI001EF687C4